MNWGLVSLLPLHSLCLTSGKAVLRMGVGRVARKAFFWEEKALEMRLEK
jgi:hypothetical protein